MRPILFSAVVAALATAAAPAMAGVHLHLPKGRHRHRAEEGSSAQPPVTTDVPEPIWTPKPR